MKTPILGSSYVARSVNAADNRLVNLFPEVVPEGGKEPAFLQRAPGLELLATIGTGPIRGFNVMGAYAYVVSGSKLYKCTSGFATVTELGTVANDGPVSMANDGNHLFVACSGPSFVYNATTAAFGQITDPDFPGALTVSYLDGYFVFIEPNSQRVWVTALLDPTSIDPLDFASAEGDPDGLVSSIVDHSEVWLFGTNSIEVWYNSGNADFPLQRIQGAFNEIGCAATFSVAKLDNGLFWLGADARGKGIVYRANGYTGQRISTHAIEWQIQQYENISDAVAYTYQMDGHAFYVLTFPSANATWVYDVSTGAWHERAGWYNGQQTRQRGHMMMSFNGRICVGDYQNGNVYAYSMDVYADYDRPQRWVRSWRALPTGQNNLKRTAQHSLQLDCEVGSGVSDPEALVTQPLQVIGITSSGLTDPTGASVSISDQMQSGDLALLIIGVSGVDSVLPVPGLDSSWTRVVTATSGTGRRLSVYQKLLLNVESSVLVQNVTVGAAMCVVLRSASFFAGRTPATINSFFSGYADPPAFNALKDDLIIAGCLVDDADVATAFNAPAGFTNVNQAISGTSIAGNGLTLVSSFARSFANDVINPGAFSGGATGYGFGFTIGLSQNQDSQNTAPRVCLRWSDDGGHTWSNEHWMDAGKIGEYGKRMIWRRLGMTQKLRDRVYELSGTDPTRIYIMGAELIVSPTNA